jgi:hypothetical protein
MGWARTAAVAAACCDCRAIQANLFPKLRHRARRQQERADAVELRIFLGHLVRPFADLLHPA